jgi:LytS/YehU family sensor histidine kinase
MRTPIESEPRARTLASIARPLFMNNLITALAALNRRNDGCRLDGAFHHLSRIFYYIDGEDERVRLGDECEFIAHYLELQRLRFEERLRYRLAVDDELLGTPVSRFCLFSAVEALVEGYVEDSAESETVLIEGHSWGAGGATVSLEREGRGLRITRIVL